MPATTIALCNLKGGVGKTSTTFHLGGTLAARGARVLLADLDPQASLTQGFLGPDAAHALDPRATAAALFGAALPPAPAELIVPTGFAGLNLLPGSAALSRHNVPEPWRCDRDDQRALADFLREAAGDYDLVLVDCPPILHLCSWAALAAADALVCPLQAEDFGSQGIASILDFVAAVRSGPNPRLRLLGYLLTMFNPRLAIHAAYAERLRTLYGDDVLATTIPIAADVKEAVALRRPIVHHKPKGASAKAVAALADELRTRLDCAAQAGTRGGAGEVAA